MNTVYSNKIVKARKVYYDECSEHLDFGLLKMVDGKKILDVEEAKEIGISDEDISVLQAACDNGFKIQIGELHKHQQGRYDGMLYDVRCSIAVSDILTKYDLWYED